MTAEKHVIGWREWVALPELGVAAIKVKADTGARSSALHAYDMEPFERRGTDWVRFVIHPYQRDTSRTVEAEAAMIDRRWIRSSAGHRTWRPVIETTLRLGHYEHPIELTLVNRDEMGFRMLLGRQAMRGWFIVDPARSYLLSQRPPGARKIKRRRKR